VTRIKICGITNLADAQYAASQGVDFLGFIFYRPSARYIEPRCASDIVTRVHRMMGNQSPRFVGVFVDEKVSEITSIREFVSLDLVQLHGNETLEELIALQPGVFKAIRPETVKDMRHLVSKYRDGLRVESQSPQLLLDAYHPTKKGGTGRLSDLEIASQLSKRYRLLLAGGLNCDNVTEVIHTVHPWGVDVSSGVEIVKGDNLIKGYKDHHRIQAFVNAVNRVDDQVKIMARKA
jgi:phosphoribosylanthranilate isomerase